MENRQIDSQRGKPAKDGRAGDSLFGRPTVSQANDDVVLLQQVVARDKHAFEQLYHSYHRRLYQFLFRIVHTPEIAEEVLNDVMYVVWNQASGFKGQSKVSTWIFGIAYRKALKEYQKTNRRPEAMGDGELPDLQDTAWNSCPEDSMANTEFSSHLKQSIEALGIEHRSVVELTALGHTYKEIAGILGCPENTVKSRMFYARRQMKKFLATHSFQTPQINKH